MYTLNYSKHADEEQASFLQKVTRMRKYVFDPVGWDTFFKHSATPPTGTIVVKYQPYGCPRNGMMDHCYVRGVDGYKYGLVHVNSLRPKTKR
jgi:hypothetical protein